MKTIKSVVAFVLAAAIMQVFVTSVNAQEVSADANSEVVCETTGDYGQNINCRAIGGASARAILTRDGVPLHQVVDTGLDTNGVLLAVGTFATGLVSTVAKLKTKA